MATVGETGNDTPYLRDQVLDWLGRTPRPRWGNYLHGVASVLAEEGLRLEGFSGVLHSTVPILLDFERCQPVCASPELGFQLDRCWSTDPME